MVTEKIIKVFVILFFMVNVAACAQNSKNNMDNKENLQLADSLELAIADKIEKYYNRSYYTLQLNKQGCRALVRVNDLPIAWNFFEDDGETLHFPINDNLPCSGKQSVTIEVYPLSTETTLSDKAHVNAKVLYAPNRNTPMDQSSIIQELNLPEALGDKNLPQYNILGEFTASVPFDFSKELKDAQDLSKVPDIEKKILAKYRQLSKMIERGDAFSFIKERENSMLKNWSYNYFTKEEGTQNLPSQKNIYNLNYPGREIASLENYEIVFYHNNKITVLRDKNDKSSLIKIYCWRDEEEKESGEEKVNAWSFIALYMPKGSNELKVW